MLTRTERMLALACALYTISWIGELLLERRDGALDKQCSAVCAPLVGDDHDGGCWCATSEGWAPVAEVAR